MLIHQNDFEIGCSLAGIFGEKKTNKLNDKQIMFPKNVTND